MSLIFSKYGMYVIAFLIIMASITSGVMYVMNLRHTVKTQSEAIVQWEKDYDEKVTQLENTHLDYNAIISLKSNLQNKNRSLAEQLEIVQNKFNKVRSNGTKRDLGALAVIKPVLVGNIINKGTLSADRCVEIASGSALKEGETKNNMCQQLIDSKIGDSK